MDASITAFPGGLMILSRIFVVEFGVFLLGAMTLVARQVVQEVRGQRRQAGGWGVNAEAMVLLAGSLATCGSYAWRLAGVGGTGMPGMAKGWVGMFGASCGIYVVSKAVRVLGVKRS